MQDNLWHVTTASKLRRYKEHGSIIPPVRAWRSLEEAERFARQTGRRVILRLLDDGSFEVLDGHSGRAFVSPNYHPVEVF